MAIPCTTHLNIKTKKKKAPNHGTLEKHYGHFNKTNHGLRAPPKKTSGTSQTDMVYFIFGGASFQLIDFNPSFAKHRPSGLCASETSRLDLQAAVPCRRQVQQIPQREAALPQGPRLRALEASVRARLVAGSPCTVQKEGVCVCAPSL